MIVILAFFSLAFVSFILYICKVPGCILKIQRLPVLYSDPAVRLGVWLGANMPELRGPQVARGVLVEREVKALRVVAARPLALRHCVPVVMRQVVPFSVVYPDILEHGEPAL